jgi:hypothetical protein
LPKVADGLHFTAVQAKNKSILVSKNSQTPFTSGGQVQRERGQTRSALRQHTYELYDLWSEGLTREWGFGRQPDYVLTIADQYISFKRQSPQYLRPELHPANRLADHKGSSRANVHDI